MKWSIRREVVPLCVLALFGILTAVFYPTWPETVPTHFGMQGEPDQFSSKTTLVVFVFAVLVFSYGLLTFIPFIDPFWKRIQPKYHILLILRDFVLLFLLFMYVLNIVATKEGKLRLDLMGVSLGLFFVLLGNYLPKLPRNWFFGIRVPWTLSSEVVWKKTHVVGGWFFAAAGLLTIILSLLQVNLLVVLLVTLTPTVLYTSLIYPLMLYRKLQREGKLSEV
ncbi:MAG: SdpI family protein [Bacteroidota bacterium]|jgi:uncharacterized membrane protein